MERRYFVDSNQSPVLNSQQPVTPSSRWSGWKNWQCVSDRMELVSGNQQTVTPSSRWSCKR